MLDTVIRNGIIIDGTGVNKPFSGDVGITGNRIVKIDSVISEDAKYIIDATGKYVCPGFIDAHAHTDALLLYCPNAEGKVLQGITTDVSGLCGTSLHPLPEEVFRQDATAYRQSFLPIGLEPKISIEPFASFTPQLTTNMPMFIGQGTLRIAVMGFDNRAPSRNELKKMKHILSHLMESGAYGLSSGLSYIPGAFTSTEELIELCAELVPFDGIYNTHMRNESNRVVESVKEAIDIGRKSGCRVHISHHKIMGFKNHGKSEETLALIEAANNEGISVTCDMYPYIAGSIGLNSLVPTWVFASGFKKAMEYLHSNSYRAIIIDELGREDWENLLVSCGAGNIVICSAENCNQYVGKTIHGIAEQMGQSEKESVLSLLEQSNGNGTIVFNSLSDIDVVNVLRYNQCAVGTDAYARPYQGLLSQGKPHPRNYSGFVHFIKEYVLERKIFSLEEGIKKITSLPAQIFQLKDRGTLNVGNIADITIWDPNTLNENGTFLNPVVKPTGIDYVLINGEMVVEDNVFTGRLSGRMLRH